MSFRFLPTFYFALLACAGCTPSSEKNMNIIQFDLGKNIATTAKESHAPRFSVRNVDGLVSYSLDDIPSTIVVRFKRPEHELDLPSLFALTMYADEANHNDLAVTIATLQVSADPTTHEKARGYIKDLLRQFNRGKWKRYIEEECPAVAGRSSFLDERGALVESTTCGLDPHYDIAQADWLQLFQRPRHYQWTGDGVHALLTVSYSEDIRGLTYDIDLELSDLEVKRRNDKKRLAEQLAEGDKEGLASTAEHAKWLKERASINKVLEQNAVKRGDHLVARDDK